MYIFIFHSTSILYTMSIVLDTMSQSVTNKKSNDKILIIFF